MNDDCFYHGYKHGMELAVLNTDGKIRLKCLVT